MNAIHPLLLSALLAAPFTAAAQTPPTPASRATPAPEADPDPVMLKAMKSKVFEVKHRSPSYLSRSLRALGSGVRGTRMDVTENGGLNTLTVRDFPENLASIEEAIKRLDVPSVTLQYPNFELHIHVLFAQKAAVTNSNVPGELLDVIKTLKGTLAYQGYSQVASFIQRVQIQPDNGFSGRGSVDQVPTRAEGGKDQHPLNFRWSSNRVGFEAQKDVPGTIQLKGFFIGVSEIGSDLAQFNTDLNFKEGEKVVVGTSVVKDRGLIVVISAKRVD